MRIYYTARWSGLNPLKAVTRLQQSAALKDTLRFRRHAVAATRRANISMAVALALVTRICGRAPNNLSSRSRTSFPISATSQERRGPRFPCRRCHFGCRRLDRELDHVIGSRRPHAQSGRCRPQSRQCHRGIETASAGEPTMAPPLFRDTKLFGVMKAAIGVSTRRGH